MPRYRGTRRLVIYEDVEVVAENYQRAMEIIEEDEVGVEVKSERESDYEVVGRLIEVHNPHWRVDSMTCIVSLIRRYQHRPEARDKFLNALGVKNGESVSDKAGGKSIRPSVQGGKKGEGGTRSPKKSVRR